MSAYGSLRLLPQRRYPLHSFTLRIQLIQFVASEAEQRQYARDCRLFKLLLRREERQARTTPAAFQGLSARHPTLRKEKGNAIWAYEIKYGVLPRTPIPKQQEDVSVPSRSSTSRPECDVGSMPRGSTSRPFGGEDTDSSYSPMISGPAPSSKLTACMPLPFPSGDAQPRPRPLRSSAANKYLPQPPRSQYLHRLPANVTNHNDAAEQPNLAGGREAQKNRLIQSPLPGR